MTQAILFFSNGTNAVLQITLLNETGMQKPFVFAVEVGMRMLNEVAGNEDVLLREAECYFCG